MSCNSVSVGRLTVCDRFPFWLPFNLVQKLRAVSFPRFQLGGDMCPRERVVNNKVSQFATLKTCGGMFKLKLVRTSLWGNRILMYSSSGRFKDGATPRCQEPRCTDSEGPMAWGGENPSAGHARKCVNSCPGLPCRWYLSSYSETVGISKHLIVIRN